MTRRLFISDKYHVATGWDRMLHGFFLTIEDPITDEVVWDNDNAGLLTGGHKFQLWHVFGKLRELGIEPPRSLRDDLMHDRAVDAGNIVYRYPPFPLGVKANDQTIGLLLDQGSDEGCGQDGP